MAQKSVKSNTVPAGGAASLNKGDQAAAFLPNTTTLAAMSEQLMLNSEVNNIEMNAETLLMGQENNFQLKNVGLGHSLELLITGTITFVESGGAANVDVSLPPDFPFNLLSNINIEFNGQTTLINMSGYEALAIMNKRRKGLLKNAIASGGSVYDQNLARVDKPIAWVKAGDNVSLTTGNGITGVTKATVTKSTTGTLDFGMYLEIPFVLRDDLLMGLVPMQNNSVYCNVKLTMNSLTGILPTAGVYIATTYPTTLATTASVTCHPVYRFWTIPGSDYTKIVQYLIQHSYMLLSQSNNALATTGVDALQYDIPTNFYLLSLLLTLRNGSGVLQDMWDMVDNVNLSYNGTSRVDRKDRRIEIARQSLYYQGFGAALGQWLWDASANIDYLSNSLNTSRWIDMYMANNPTLNADIASSFTTTGKFSVLREQLVPAKVKVI